MIVTGNVDVNGNPVIMISVNQTETAELVSALNFAKSKLQRTVQAEVSKTLVPMTAQNTLTFVSQLLSNISQELEQL